MLAGQLLHAHRVWWMSFHYRSCDFDEEYEKDTEKDNKDETEKMGSQKNFVNAERDLPECIFKEDFPARRSTSTTPPKAICPLSIRKSWVLDNM